MTKRITDSFTLEENPCWECPTCHQKTLEIVKGEVHQRYDSISKKIIEYENKEFGGDPHPYALNNGVFTAMLYCVSKTCNESVACSGTLSFDVDYEEDWANNSHEVHVTRFKPKMFVPPLHPFIIPYGCDELVSDPLLSSFSLLPSNPGSAANNLRIAVERFIDVLAVPPHRFLHQRIKMLEMSDQKKAHLLMSIKWMGNSGSHKNASVTARDVMSGYAVFKRLLDDQYPVTTLDTSEVEAEKLHAKFDANYVQKS